jgi:ubiquitin-conjugating enzyme E2 S
MSKLIAKEIKSLLSKPPPGITVSLENDNISVVLADFEGPEGTAYEGGLFRARFDLVDYPTCPPQSKFLTRIFHPNVNSAGDICVSALKKDWDSKLGLRHLFMVIRCLLIHPNPASALNEEAGKLLLEQFDEFAKRARMHTSIHARKHVPVVAEELVQPAVPIAAVNDENSQQQSSHTHVVLDKMSLLRPRVAAAKPLRQPIVSHAARKALKRL